MYKTIAESNNYIVLDKYTKFYELNEAPIAYQSEAALEKEFIHSLAIGMQSKDEIDANIQMVEKGYIKEETSEKLKKSNRRLIVDDYCQACGNCVERCQQGGITLVNGIAKPSENCILCGYCATVCPEFCIKVI